MSNLFYRASAFNQPIAEWNTAGVADMSCMFYRASAFNQPIAAWNTAGVGDMSRWNTSGVSKDGSKIC